MTCPHCGGDIIGDGYTTPMYCENLPLDINTQTREPNAPVLFCNGTEAPNPEQGD